MTARRKVSALEAAWKKPERPFDPEGNQRWRSAEEASAYLASLSPERRAQLERESWA